MARMLDDTRDWPVAYRGPGIRSASRPCPNGSVAVTLMGVEGHMVRVTTFAVAAATSEGRAPSADRRRVHVGRCTSHVPETVVADSMIGRRRYRVILSGATRRCTAAMDLRARGRRDGHDDQPDRGRPPVGSRSPTQASPRRSRRSVSRPSASPT